MSNQLIQLTDAVIVRQENLSTIIQSGPESYRLNVRSCQKCAEAGQALLDEVSKNGMSDDLDQRIAKHLEKARNTVKIMNERRSPVTKLFDQVRTEFTTLENSTNPTQKGTVHFQLQQLRNEYAAKKHEEEERRRQAELAAQEVIRAKETYRAAVEEDYNKMFDDLVTRELNQLTELNTGTTLENYKAVFDTVTGYSVTLPADWCPLSNVRRPYNLTAEETKTILNDTFQKLLPKFEEQYRFEVESYRDDILDKLPSKKVELERIASANAAEKAKLASELAAREAAEAQRKEIERQKAEEEARKKAELEKANAEMAGLFSMAKAEQVYTPKAKVTRKLQINDPQAFLAIVSMWWQREGCKLSVDELSKIFKKQVTFCEKLANKENEFIESPGLQYIDDVKAQ